MYSHARAHALFFALLQTLPPHGKCVAAESMPRVRSSYKKSSRICRVFLLSCCLLLFVVLSTKRSLSELRRNHLAAVEALSRDARWKTLHDPKGGGGAYYPPSKLCRSGTNDTRTLGAATPGNFGFVFGGLGGYARLEAFKCVLAIESLVRVAGYDGDVYFITENIASSCVPSQEELRARLGYDRVHVVYVDEGSPSPFEKSSDAERTNGTRSRRRPLRKYLRDMSIKMDIFDYLPKRIEVAAWYDCDVVFGVHGCARNNLMCAIPEFSHATPMYTSLGSAGWHVGSFMVHRVFSAKLLREWKEEFFTGRHISDYPAIEALYERQERTGNLLKRWDIGHFTRPRTGNTYSHDWSVLTSDPSAGEMYSAWRDVIFDKKTPNSCIMHLTTGRCSELNSGTVATDALIRSLGLFTPGNVRYCSGTPRKVILQQGLAPSWKSCVPPPADFVFPLKARLLQRMISPRHINKTRPS